MTPIPLTVLGGFLGAGKTTLLNHLLRSRLRRVAVLVNDFGEIAIDAELIVAHDGDTISLANGCVCCSLAGGLMQTLLALRQRAEPPEHLLIETSGVADPWKIAQIGLAGRAYRLHGVIVLADAETLRAQANDPRIGDTVRRQLEVADLLVLNKCDLVGETERAEVRDWLRARQPRSRIVETVQATVPPALLLGDGSRQPLAGQLAPSAQRHEADFHRWSFTTQRRFDTRALRALLDDLPVGVLRAKGIVRLNDGTTRVLQLVGRRWSLLPAGDDHGPSRLVLLGGEFDPAELEQRFTGVLG